MTELELPPEPTIGLLHPGAMGAVVGGVLAHPVIWASEGRSAETRDRAEANGLTDVATVAAVTSRADVILSICPPESAVAVADLVLANGFDGIYVDANAVAPATSRAIGARFDRFVDGGIVGPPPTAPGSTRLYLSGSLAPLVAALFGEGPMEARVVDDRGGSASAVKMCFASWTKGTAAMLLAIRALAEREGVTEALLGEWATSMPDLVARSDGVATTGPKAWRFEGEMREIASTFAADDLPPGFHEAAAEIYQRLAGLRGTSHPTIDDALKLL